MLPSDSMSRHHPHVVTRSGSVVASAQSAEAAHRASRRSDNVGSSVNRAGPEVATRFVGNCQVCERDIKLYSVVPGSEKDDDLRMVHHGYKRPGHGSIVGDCPGVGELPYERSRAIVETMLASAEAELAGSREYLRRLNAGEVDGVTLDVWDYKASKTLPKRFVRGEVNDWEWRDALGKATFKAERAVDFWDSNVKHLRRRVTDWKLKPVRTFDEILEKVQAQKAERAKIVAEKRAVRDAKIAATKAKQADLVVRREAIAKDLAVKFQSLADAGDVKGGQALARKQKKHMGWLYVDSLGVNAALVKLGLAKWRDDRKRFEDDVWVEHHYFG